MDQLNLIETCLRTKKKILCKYYRIRLVGISMFYQFFERFFLKVQAIISSRLNKKYY